MANPNPVREFTLEEASALIPRLTVEFGRIARLRDQIAEVARELGGPNVAVELLEHQRLPTPGESARAEQLRALADDVNRTLERIQDLGCVVKDVELGLVDFHAQIEGRRVFLCWQFGEATIAHLHGLDEGFADRRPLETEGQVEEAPAPRWLN